MPWLPPDPPDAPAWQPPDPPDEDPGMLSRMGNTALGALQWQIERGGRAAMDFPGQVMEAGRFVADVAPVVGKGIGLPIEHTEEQGRKFDSAMTDVALTMAGGAGAGMVSRWLGKGARFLARGLRSEGNIARMLARNPEAVAAAGGPGRTAGIMDLLSPTIAGTTVGSLVNASDPTPYELTDAPVAGAAGIASTAYLARGTIDDLLFQSPKWRNFATSRASSGPLSIAVGGVLGYLASKGLEIGPDTIDDVVAFITEDEEPARGEAVMGPIGGAAVPVDQQALARALMAR